MSSLVDFEAKIKSARSASGSGYPIQISAADLMRNFVHAALEADPSLIDQTTGQGGYPQRKLKIPALPTEASPRILTATSGSLTWNEGFPEPPSTGTHVLGVKDGTLQWLATEAC